MTKVITRVKPNLVRSACLAALGVFIVGVASLQALRRDRSPLDDAISYYAHGPWEWILSVSLFALALATLLLLVLLRARAEVSRLPRALLCVWAACLVLGAVFRADPPGNWDQPRSLADSIHGGVSMIGLLAIAIAAPWLTRQLCRSSNCSRLLRSAAAAVPLSYAWTAFALVPAVAGNQAPTLLGLSERVLFFAIAAWTGITAFAVSTRPPKLD